MIFQSKLLSTTYAGRGDGVCNRCVAGGKGADVCQGSARAPYGSYQGAGGAERLRGGDVDTDMYWGAGGAERRRRSGIDRRRVHRHGCRGRPCCTHGLGGRRGDALPGRHGPCKLEPRAAGNQFILPSPTLIGFFSRISLMLVNPKSFTYSKHPSQSGIAHERIFSTKHR